MENAPHRDENTGACFPQTQWSVVLAAGHTGSPDADAALEKLCRDYWPPLYAAIRRHGHSPDEAQDLTQEFFSQLLRRHDVDIASPEKGRFRALLLTMLKHFLINAWHRENCQKRGGGQVAVFLDAAPVEARYQVELVDTATPETVFERHWAFTVLDHTMNRLREEYASTGKTDLFDLLKETLSSQKQTPRAELAARCGTSVGAVDVAVHRLRRRYGELLREEIANTVSEPGEIEEEIRHLKAVLGRSGGR
jgi:RNA polymerase sigma-70 factor (ECF subfamily)